MLSKAIPIDYVHSSVCSHAPSWLKHDIWRTGGAASNSGYWCHAARSLLRASQKYYLGSQIANPPLQMIVIPYSSLAMHKRLSDVELRVDILSRLRAARLEASVQVSAAKDKVLILVGAPLERLEREADLARLCKPLRSGGERPPPSCPDSPSCR